MKISTLSSIGIFKKDAKLYSNKQVQLFTCIQVSKTTLYNLIVEYTNISPKKINSSTVKKLKNKACVHLSNKNKPFVVRKYMRKLIVTKKFTICFQDALEKAEFIKQITS